ncbi:hypothetical protein SLEP1_g20911 [Rubroshorea leprosula]|uniref:Uncharacterized protein n=1 Tax=Rubroshorea leprosula TaxID=152421 RepID=A0AAV5JA34_9ROSI|nr:hypothetical protein SLEP1_g20911 [Rubroshorea leprosula]
MQVISTVGSILPIHPGRIGRNTVILSHPRLSLISRLDKDRKKLFQSLTSPSRSSGHRKMNMVSCCTVGSGPPLPPDSSPGSWKGWILGVVVTVILPFWINKLGPLLKFKEEVETVAETAEQVADIVEKVAEEVEKVADEVSDALPEGGKLQGFVNKVENVAKETAKDAHLVGEVIGKVEEVEKEVESFFAPGKDQGSQGGSSLDKI